MKRRASEGGEELVRSRERGMEGEDRERERESARARERERDRQTTEISGMKLCDGAC